MYFNWDQYIQEEASSSSRSKGRPREEGLGGGMKVQID